MTGHAGDSFAASAALEGVPSALSAARDGIDAVLGDRARRRTSPAVTAESLLRGAVASARLAGSTSTLEQVRSGDGDDVAMRAVRLYSGLLALAPVIARSPLQALARMHTLVSAGTEPADLVGRPRSDPACGEFLRQLSGRLLAPTAAPALAVAGLVHAHLIVAAPFGGANDLVARALERLVLVSRGVDPASSIVPEAGHLRLRHEYEAILATYRIGDPASERRWLLHVAAACGQPAVSEVIRQQ